MLRVVFGTKPRKIPFLELWRNFAEQGVEGFTQTRHPKVQKLRKFSFQSVIISIGEQVCPCPTNAFRMRII